MKDETEFELKRSFMIRDKQHITDVISFLIYLSFLALMLLFLGGCGVAEKMCPRNTFHAGCNTLIGKEKLNVKSMNEHIELLEMKIELLDLHLSNLRTRDAELEYELRLIEETLYLFKNNIELDLKEINNRLNTILKRLSNGKK